MFVERALRRVTMVAGLLLLAGCASQPPAPVLDLSLPSASSQTINSAAKPTVYIVRSGDSLYAISMQFNLDWRDLAYWNGIDAPYVLQPGERLRLSPPPASAVAQTRAPPRTTRITTQPLISTPVTPVASPPNATAPAAPVAPAHTPVVAPVPSAPPPAPPAGATTPSNQTTRSVAGIDWSWPAKGTLITRFGAGDPTRQGIDIAGQHGDPVRAAADGIVVYSGDGLVGYGELIIIKHSDTYLSAYGHNAKRLVHEGDHVRAGQRIANMGSSGTSRTELHFEIRKQGKPVDPLAFLPQR